MWLIYMGQYYLNQQFVLCCAIFLVFIQAFAVVRCLKLLNTCNVSKVFTQTWLDPVYFSKNDLQLLNYGKNEK